MSLLPVIMLGIAVSLDGFGIGLAFGLRKLRLPLLSLFVICLFSSASVFVSMQLGALASGLFSPRAASFLGGFILILVGACLARQALRGEGERPVVQNSEGGQNSGLAFLSVVLRDPSQADSDNSGTISAGEAMFLGITLALDALGAGFAAAMMDFSPADTTIVVALSKFMFVSAGLCMGRRYAENSGEKRTAAFSGMILMVMGLAHLSRTLFNL